MLNCDGFVGQPDITAPGVYILAAWSEASSPTKLDRDHRVAKYNLLSGTSMSCPHIAASCALLKAIHPKWSSAAIRSAMITSGTFMSFHFKPSQFFLALLDISYIIVRTLKGLVFDPLRKLKT